MSHYPERKARNKKQVLTDEQWEEIVFHYSIHEQSITTLSAHYKVGHDLIKQGLIARNIPLEKRDPSKTVKKRAELIPRGKFSDNPFFKR